MTSFWQLSDGFCFNWPIKMQELWKVEMSSSMFALWKLTSPPPTVLALWFDSLNGSHQKVVKNYSKPLSSGNDRACPDFKLVYLKYIPAIITKLCDFFLREQIDSMFCTCDLMFPCQHVLTGCFIQIWSINFRQFWRILKSNKADFEIDDVIFVILRHIETWPPLK